MVTTAMRVDVAAWCGRSLGLGTITELDAVAGGQMSTLFRYESDEQGLVAVKVRTDSVARIGRCLQIQRMAADAGFPCATPVTGAESLGQGLVVSAETWRPGGEIHTGGGPPFADRSAKLLAKLAGILGSESPSGLGPPPPWMHWNPLSGGLWPPNPPIDAMDQDLVPVHVRSIARSVAARLARSVLPVVVGHGDWESQNLRWEATRPWAVHDWDSLVALPEAAIVGAAAGAFASTIIPTLATVEESEEFINAYEQAKDNRFSNDEREIAWAASLWPALHNARGESLFQSQPVALGALTRQATERLHRAGAR